MIGLLGATAGEWDLAIGTSAITLGVMFGAVAGLLITGIPLKRIVVLFSYLAHGMWISCCAVVVAGCFWLAITTDLLFGKFVFSLATGCMAACVAQMFIPRHNKTAAAQGEPKP